ncbi:collagen alpha-1(III) chain-like [Mastomys coucha]|uniref:collagen alpha-1(III) chain-like n=1 Tax=Mastomys coucha TaxID=35658 RepID=UPI001261FDDD|nr:collagen alpha-1(III) chain-like [Mastomys coucha]
MSSRLGGERQPPADPQQRKTEQGCPGRGGLGGKAVATRATSPAGATSPRAPQDAQPAAHPPPGPALTARSRCSHAGGARWARRTRGTGPGSCKLCAALARRGNLSAPGRSPGAAAGRAPGGSGGAEGGVSGRRSPGQRAALFTAGPPSSPARALRAPDIIHSRTLASPLLLPSCDSPRAPRLPRLRADRVSPDA